MDPFLGLTEKYGLILQISTLGDSRLKSHLVIVMNLSAVPDSERWRGPQRSHHTPDWCHWQPVNQGDSHSPVQPHAAVSDLFGQNGMSDSTPCYRFWPLTFDVGDELQGSIFTATRVSRPTGHKAYGSEATSAMRELSLPLHAHISVSVGCI